MKDEDIKLPEIDETVLRFHVKGESPKIWDHIEKWAVSQSGTQASRLANNIDLAITEAMQEYARQAVRMNMPAAQPKPSDPEPFDLARAIAGEPIVTRAGRKARFVAHVPEITEKGCRVLALVAGQDYVSSYFEDGLFRKHGQHECDLFMAPKPKRTVWVNLYKREGDGVGPGWIESGAFYNQKDALSFKSESNLILLAHPIEIDATE